MNKFINVEYISPIVRFFFINLISILKKKKSIAWIMNHPVYEKKNSFSPKTFPPDYRKFLSTSTIEEKSNDVKWAMYPS